MRLALESACDSMKQYRAVFWDWNGTLVNDVQLNLDVINEMLSKRDLKILTINEYLNAVEFPIVGYYKKVGFDLQKEPFAELAKEYVQLYYSRAKGCPLHKGAKEALEALHRRGMVQYLLSAAEEEALKDYVSAYEIEGYFKGIYGQRDHHARGKLGAGEALMVVCGFAPSEILLIGDTTHDAEVADALGMDCVLVAMGHQSKEKLQATGKPALKDLKALNKYLI